ncbi:MAG: Fic family protein [Desulfobacterales bacterium]|nr:Fic family protein [Desulfobacterales bacterium]
MLTRIDQMTPYFPPGDEALTGRAEDLMERSARLGGILHPITGRTIIAYLRMTNSYYSNLIEDHHTHPLEIERALAGDYAQDPAKRAMQIEGLTHVEVQEMIDAKLAGDPSVEVCSLDFICWIHREFYNRLPDEMLVITDAEGKEKAKVIPGELRRREVEVARHVAPSWESLPAFLGRFHELYEPDRFKTTTARLLAAVTSHHRLVWIHPFLDGNGRVARLMTDAYFRRIGLTGTGLWTVSRGLARHRDRYMTMLAEADAPRRGDLDGRGNLSQSGLVAFCRFFLETCADQIDFMGRMLDLQGLMDRIQGYVALRGQKMIPGRPALRPEAGHLLREALLRGSFPRGEASRVTGLGERTARTLISQLADEHLLTSDTPKGDLKIGLPTHIVQYYFPDLLETIGSPSLSKPLTG